MVPVVTTDWGGGYCVELQVTNASTVPTTNWSATLNTNQTTIFSTSGATFSGTTGTVNITPNFASNQVIDPPRRTSARASARTAPTFRAADNFRS